MKWFKHETDSSESEGLRLLRGLHGMAGYGRWFVLLEIVASKMDTNTDRCSVSYPLSWWSEKLDLSPRKTWIFLKSCEKLCKISVETASELLSNCNGTDIKLQRNCIISRTELVSVSVPNLLNKRDSHNKTREA